MACLPLHKCRTALRAPFSRPGHVASTISRNSSTRPSYRSLIVQDVTRCFLCITGVRSFPLPALPNFIPHITCKPLRYSKLSAPFDRMTDWYHCNSNSNRHPRSTYSFTVIILCHTSPHNCTELRMQSIRYNSPSTNRTNVRRSKAFHLVISVIFNDTNCVLRKVRKKGKDR